MDGNNPQESLSRDEMELLHTKILPTARRWVQQYPERSEMYRHGMQTLEYWREK